MALRCINGTKAQAPMSLSLGSLFFVVKITARKGQGPSPSPTVLVHVVFLICLPESFWNHVFHNLIFFKLSLFRVGQKHDRKFERYQRLFKGKHPSHLCPQYPGLHGGRQFSSLILIGNVGKPPASTSRSFTVGSTVS